MALVALVLLLNTSIFWAWAIEHTAISIANDNIILFILIYFKVIKLLNLTIVYIRSSVGNIRIMMIVEIYI